MHSAKENHFMTLEPIIKKNLFEKKALVGFKFYIGLI